MRQKRVAQNTHTHMTACKTNCDNFPLPPVTTHHVTICLRRSHDSSHVPVVQRMAGATQESPLSPRDVVNVVCWMCCDARRLAPGRTTLWLESWLRGMQYSGFSRIHCPNTRYLGITGPVSNNIRTRFVAILEHRVLARSA